MTRRLMLIALLSVSVVGLAARGDEQAMRNVPRISIDEVKALMAKKQVLLIDVRDPAAFGEGHIPGAMSVPFDFLPDHADAWKTDKRLLVTYCACVNEGTAARAALDMNTFGVKNVKALLGGYNEWVKRGEKIATGR